MGNAVNEQQTEAAGTQDKKRSMMPFWILLAVCGVPYVFSWIYFANMDDMPELQTSNRGQLIEPVRSVDNITLKMADGSDIDTSTWKGYWVLATVGSSNCEKECLSKVYYLRQIRRLMGEERQRINRLFVLTDNQQIQAFNDKVAEFGEMQIVSAETEGHHQLLNLMTIEGQSPENRIFIIDPLANLMMVYAGDTKPEDIAKDFRRLLKVSRIGAPKTAG